MTLPRKLPSGLILRRSTRADAGRLAEFNAMIHKETEEPDARVAAWTEDLLSIRHPTFGEGDFTLIEDPSSGKIVSALNLISQTWSFAGIPFKVGRPELVGTDLAYRNRGLVRLQFDEIHEWSRQRGELVQGITGIPYYYRLFGYEMAVNLGGGRSGSSFSLPRLEKDAAEPFLVRKAQEADLDFIADLAEKGARRSLLAARRDKAMWTYELSGASQQNVNRLEFRVITTPEGAAIGFLAHPFFLWGETLALTIYELAPGISWQAVTPSVIRYLWQAGEEYAQAENKPHTAFRFSLGENHPAYQVAAHHLPRVHRRYAWYLRVPDLPAFLRLIAPVLEQRLAESPLFGHTGEIKIGFYRNGLLLKFQSGRLADIEPWKPEASNIGQAAFPGLTFLQILFGYRSLDELLYAFPDCYANLEVTPLLKALFPPQVSEIWPIQ